MTGGGAKRRGGQPNANARGTPRPWRVALSLFTVIPAGAGASIRRDTAARALPWLPVVGALIAAIAAGAMLAVQAGGQSEGRRLLAATLAVAILGLLTGGLHLDGLADTADGLGSRRPSREALAIMRRPDIGPMGVAALLLVILVQITALAAIPPGGLSVAALILAAVTGRVAVVLATGPGSPSARPGGFGALITNTTTGPESAFPPSRPWWPPSRRAPSCWAPSQGRPAGRGGRCRMGGRPGDRGPLAGGHAGRPAGRRSVAPHRPAAPRRHDRRRVRRRHRGVHGHRPASPRPVQLSPQAPNGTGAALVSSQRRRCGIGVVGPCAD